LAVELVLVADVFALAPCVFVDCIVNLLSFARFTGAVPAKDFGKLSLTGTRFTEAVPAKEFGEMLLVGLRFTEAVTAEEFGKMLLIGTRSTENLVLSFSWLATTM
jgi:hypothetical protein